jgi:hypothetical protein
MIHKRKKPSVGDSKKIGAAVFVVEELFTADGVRWVRATTHRKKSTVGFQGKRYTEYVSDNRYMSEFEWIRL